MVILLLELAETENMMLVITVEKMELKKKLQKKFKKENTIFKELMV